MLRKTFASLWTHKKLTLLFAVMAALLVHVIQINYTLQKPWLNKRDESYLSVWNGRAACLTQLDNLKSSAAADLPAGMSQNNIHALEHWNDPAQ